LVSRYKFSSSVNVYWPIVDRINLVLQAKSTRTPPLRKVNPLLVCFRSGTSTYGRRSEPRVETLPLRPRPPAGETPIFVATDTDSRLLNGAEDGIVPLLTYFLSRGGDPAAPDAKGCTPLHNAAQYGAFISRPFNLCDFLGLIS